MVPDRFGKADRTIELGRIRSSREDGGRCPWEFPWPFSSHLVDTRIPTNRMVRQFRRPLSL